MVDLDVSTLFVSDGLYGNAACERGRQRDGSPGGVRVQGEGYDHDTNKCAEGKDCSTYLQIVWKNSTKIGCGEVRNVSNRLRGRRVNIFWE